MLMDFSTRIVIMASSKGDFPDGCMTFLCVSDKNSLVVRECDTISTLRCDVDIKCSFKLIDIKQS